MNLNYANKSVMCMNSGMHMGTCILGLSGFILIGNYMQRILH